MLQQERNETDIVLRRVTRARTKELPTALHSVHYTAEFRRTVSSDDYDAAIPILSTVIDRRCPYMRIDRNRPQVTSYDVHSQYHAIRRDPSHMNAIRQIGK